MYKRGAAYIEVSLKTAQCTRKNSLNIAKTLKNIAQKQILYLGTRCPRYGQ